MPLKPEFKIDLESLHQVSQTNPKSIHENPLNRFIKHVPREMKGSAMNDREMSPKKIPDSKSDILASSVRLVS